MPSISEQQEGYRRGLVLGLTMAEIAVLVIFVLLLVLGALLALKDRENEELQERNRILRASLSEFDRIVETNGGHFEDVIRELARAKETRRSLDRLQQEVTDLQQEIQAFRELQQVLETNRPKTMAERPLPEVFRELLLLRSAVMDSGVAPSPHAVRKALIEAANKDDLLQLAEQRAQELTRQKDDLNARLTELQRTADRGGRGLDHPPCWATPDGKAEYIFDIALTSKGLIIRERELPHRVIERNQLPLHGLALNEELVPSRFLDMTRELFVWSRNNDCRFVVRAFDDTASTEKTTYKRHMRVLEQHFYKYEELEEPF